MPDHPTLTRDSNVTLTDHRPWAVLRPWALTGIGWAVVVAAASASGLLGRLPAQAIPVLVAAGITLPLLVYRRSPATKDLVARVDLAHLTWFNVWRVPAAAVFFWYGAQALLPARFVTNAAWGDLIAGVAAALVVLLARYAGRRRRLAYLSFHVFSFGDFVVAVGTGITFTLIGDPLMHTLTQFPIALIPFWGVPITGVISLLALHRLLTQR